MRERSFTYFAWLRKLHATQRNYNVYLPFLSLELLLRLNINIWWLARQHGASAFGLVWFGLRPGDNKRRSYRKNRSASTGIHAFTHTRSTAPTPPLPHRQQNDPSTTQRPSPLPLSKQTPHHHHHGRRHSPGPQSKSRARPRRSRGARGRTGRRTRRRQSARRRAEG